MLDLAQGARMDLENLDAPQRRHAERVVPLKFDDVVGLDPPAGDAESRSWW
jgi:hypothetical protein